MKHTTKPNSGIPNIVKYLIPSNKGELKLCQDKDGVAPLVGSIPTPGNIIKELSK
jgi:hypothetical protein